MTLIAAMSIEGYTRLFADTRVSHPDVTQVEQLPGRLKLLVLHAYLCIGYAGSADYAIDTIRALKIDPESELNDTALVSLLPLLAEASADGRVEFLIAAYIRDRGTILLTVAERTVFRYREMTWIGDEDAIHAIVNRMGRIRIEFRPEDPRGLRFTFQLAAEFASIVHDHVVDSVGGIPIAVELQPAGFRYMQTIGSFFPLDDQPANYVPPVVFGSASDGGFAYTVLVPQQMATAVVGVHFHQGRIGYLYLPMQQDRPRTYADVTCEEFRRRVHQDEGLVLLGFCAGEE